MLCAFPIGLEFEPIRKEESLINIHKSGLALGMEGLLCSSLELDFESFMVLFLF